MTAQIKMFHNIVHMHELLTHGSSTTASVGGLAPPTSAPHVSPTIRALRLDFLIGLRDGILLLPG